MSYESGEEVDDDSFVEMALVARMTSSEDYDQLRKRNLWGDKPIVRGNEREFSLVALAVVDNGATVASVVDAKGTLYRVAVNDYVDNLKVISMGDDHVVLQDADEQHVLKLYE